MPSFDPAVVALRLALLGSLGALAACGDKARPKGGEDGEDRPTAKSAAPEGSLTSGAGYVKNDRGVVVRLGPPKCDPKQSYKPCSGTESKLGCKSDVDCTERRFGVCGATEARPAATSSPAVESSCGCRYGCSEDSDCAPGMLCVCGDVLGRESECVPASCGMPSDCGSGVCALSDYFNGCGQQTQIACKAASDVCQSDADCKPDRHGDKTRCALGAPRSKEPLRWDCHGRNDCQVGRPLVVDGQARAAPPARRSDWGASAASLDGSAPLPRVAAHWLRIAALEHASVASFARFALQLAALGAPAELVAATQRAGLDEIEHAMLAYGLAASYGAPRSGPSALPVAGAPLSVDPVEIASALIDEGCVGESCAAAEAAVLAERCERDDVRAALRRIAVDELEHARLAFRSLRWLARTHGEAARAAVARAAQRLGRTIPIERGDDGADDAEHGVMSLGEAAELRARVVHDVVLPGLSLAIQPETHHASAPSLC